MQDSSFQFFDVVQPCPCLRIHAVVHSILQLEFWTCLPVSDSPSWCRSMLACSASAWDMFFVYEVDFLRELKDVIANGMQVASLEVRPFGGLSGVSEFFADFNWQPDGRYATFVRCAVLVYLAHIMAHERPLVPHWLLEDLVSLGASFTPRGNATERCIAGLKSSILASKTNRTGGRGRFM